MILGLLLLLLFLITGLLLLIVGFHILLFLIGLLIICGLLLATSGFVFGSTRGLLLLRIIMFSISDAVFELYVRPSDVLTFESNNILDLSLIHISEPTRPY